MADFQEVFEKIKDSGFAFSIVASGKRKGALSVMVGSTPIKEAEYADRLFPRSPQKYPSPRITGAEADIGSN